MAERAGLNRVIRAAATFTLCAMLMPLIVTVTIGGMAFNLLTPR